MPKDYNLFLKGVVGGYDFDANFVDYVLTRMKGKPVSVLIDSRGGSLMDALSIAAAFEAHGDVTVHFRSMNASAATIASLGAKHIAMDASAMYLVHKCAIPVVEWSNMNADRLAAKIAELQQAKSDLEKIDLNVAAMYAAKCRKPQADLLALMTKGGWLTAQEALDWGFVDEVTGTADAQPALTEAVAMEMNAAGVPLPDLPIQKEKSGAFARLLTNLTALVKGDTSHTNTKTTMNKSFTHLNSLLSVEGLAASNDGKILLTEAQAQEVENRLQACHEQISALSQVVGEQEATIKALRTAPADTSHAVVDTPAADPQARESSSISTRATVFSTLSLAA